MARIPDAELARLKAEVSVQRLVDGCGVELRKQGSDLVGACPFHDDSTPSLVITPGKNLWHCLGACGRGGGPIDWVMTAQGVSFRHAVDLWHCLGACARGGGPIDWVMSAQGVSFRHAVELLRESSPSLSVIAQSSPLAKAPGPPSRSTTAKLPALAAPDAADQELLNKVVGYYADALAGHAGAQEFLGRRKIDHPEAIETFRVGFADRTLGYRLPPSQVQAGRALRTRLRDLGVLKANGHEHFRGYLTFPVLDVDGNVGEVYGRLLGKPDQRTQPPKHLYLPGPHRGVWNIAAFAETDELIVAESVIDALTLWCAGFPARHRGLRHRWVVPGAPAGRAGAWDPAGADRVRRRHGRRQGRQGPHRPARSLGRRVLPGRTAWSPQQIARRLPVDFPEDESMRISHEAIYQALYIQGRGALKRELVACLRTGRALRVPRARTRNRAGGHVSADVVISQRPAEVEDRAVPGHWEGDLIIGLNRSAIGTLVERTSRYTMLVHLPRAEGYGATPRVKNGPALAGYGAVAMKDALASTMTTLPEQLRRTLTWDRGKELAQHAQFKVETGIAVYFADPHSLWQRATNENHNGLLRQHFPKGTDLSRWSSEELRAVETALNGRPRKTLNWRTPAETLDEHLRLLPQGGVASIG